MSTFLREGSGVDLLDEALHSSLLAFFHHVKLLIKKNAHLSLNDLFPAFKELLFAQNEPLRTKTSQIVSEYAQQEICANGSSPILMDIEKEKKN